MQAANSHIYFFAYKKVFEGGFNGLGRYRRAGNDGKGTKGFCFLKYFF
jgi:hypothetical protein